MYYIAAHCFSVLSEWRQTNKKRKPLTQHDHIGDYSVRIGGSVDVPTEFPISTTNNNSWNHQSTLSLLIYYADVSLFVFTLSTEAGCVVSQLDIPLQMLSRTGGAITTPSTEKCDNHFMTWYSSASGIQNSKRHGYWLNICFIYIEALSHFNNVILFQWAKSTKRPVLFGWCSDGPARVIRILPWAPAAIASTHKAKSISLMSTRRPTSLHCSARVQHLVSHLFSFPPATARQLNAACFKGSREKRRLEYRVWEQVALHRYHLTVLSCA